MSISQSSLFFFSLNQNDYSIIIIMISCLFAYYRNKTMLSSCEKITVIIRVNCSILDFEKFLQNNLSWGKDSFSFQRIEKNRKFVSFSVLNLKIIKLKTSLIIKFKNLLLLSMFIKNINLFYLFGNKVIQINFY